MFPSSSTIHNGKAEFLCQYDYEEDDEDMSEAGEDYQAIINVPFKMVMVQE